jgi:hypothetical protein
MRVLYVAGWSSPQNLETDSTLTWVRGWLLPWLRSRPDVFLFVTCPGGEYERASRKALEELLAEPRVRAVWTANDQTKQYREMTAWQPELARFDELYGTYPWIDLVITDRPAALPEMICSTESYTRMGGWPRTYVVPVQFLMDHVSTPFALPSIRRAQAYGWGEADLTLWSGENHRKRGIDEARMWLSSERLAKVMTGARTYLGGLNLEGASKYARPMSERPVDNPIVVWGSAMNVAYFPLEIFGEYDRAFSTGHSLRLRVVTSSSLAEDNQRIREMIPERYLSWVEWYAALKQTDFWNVASEGAVFVAGAMKSEFSYSWAELATLGLVGVYQERDEIMSTVVPGYPFTWRGRDDVRGWLRHLVIEGHWRDSEAQEWVARQRAFLADGFTGAANWPRFDAEVRDLLAKRGKPKESLTELIVECTAEAGDEMTLAQFSRRLKAWSKFGKSITQKTTQSGGGRYAMSRSVYRGVLLREGWDDACDAEEPRFVRRKA